MEVKIGDLFEHSEETVLPNPHNRALEQIDFSNSQSGNLNLIDGVECKICHNKGVIYFLKGNDEICVKECSCMEKRRFISRAKKSGMGEYAFKNFKDFNIEEPWQRKCTDVMKKYCSEAEKPSWFAVLGQQGSGKTLMCSIIANSLMDKAKKKVVFVIWADFVSKLKRDIMSGNAEQATYDMERVKNAEVLYIDDIFKQGYTDADLKYASEIINYRYNNSLKTIITAQYTINELLDIDEATFGRVVEMSGEYIIVISRNLNHDWRLTHMSRITKI